MSQEIKRQRSGTLRYDGSGESRKGWAQPGTASVCIRWAIPMASTRILWFEGDSDHDFSEDLRRVLRTELLQDDCSATNVASLFSMHRRTLNRRLHAEGTAFRQVVDEVRFELARELLAKRGMTFGQIAAALKFSEASAFTRAFCRWSGQTPTAWRAAHCRGRKRFKGQGARAPQPGSKGEE
jgi:AraC-like DNA-binding protein